MIPASEAPTLVENIWLAFCLSLCMFAVLFTVYLAFSMSAHAAGISITGHSIGHGMHTLSFWGQHLNASIVQGLNNSSTWAINVTGEA